MLKNINKAYSIFSAGWTNDIPTCDYICMLINKLKPYFSNGKLSQTIEQPPPSKYMSFSFQRPCHYDWISSRTSKINLLALKIILHQFVCCFTNFVLNSKCRLFDNPILQGIKCRHQCVFIYLIIHNIFIALTVHIDTGVLIWPPIPFDFIRFLGTMQTNFSDYFEKIFGLPVDLILLEVIIGFCEKLKVTAF